MNITIRDIYQSEYEALGKLMVSVYSQLEGFPLPDEQPGYYDMLRNIGALSERDHTRVLVAVSDLGNVLGGVVYNSDMSEYGSGGQAFREKQASGICLLGVDRNTRGLGIGRSLACKCLELAKESGSKQIILHTTAPMNVAWRLYESLGFTRSVDLDFLQEGLPVYGFRYQIKQN